MHLELLCTGDELLTGLTVDTNSAFLAERLLGELGVFPRRTQVVGDDRPALIKAMRELSTGADVAVVSGGLGPTADDLTVESLAEALGLECHEDQAVLERLRARFAKRGITFTPNNARQARVPEGAKVIDNPVGTAPMLVVGSARCTFLLLPGVPREFRYLAEHEVMPFIATQLAKEGGRIFRAHRLLQTVGLPESHLDAMVEPLAKLHPKVRFGFRTRGLENQLKLLSEAPSQQEADEALENAAVACRQELGPWLFGEGGASLWKVVGARLKERKETLAVAESCTGGLICQLLTSEAGASDFFLGGFVAYSEMVKASWVGVSKQSLENYGAVSEPVAKELAAEARRRAGASYGLSVTGFAGPTGGTANDPVGTVYLGLSHARANECQRLKFPGDRDRVREFAAHAALAFLWKHLAEEGGV